MQKTEVFVLTGEVIIRDYTESELEQLKLDMLVTKKLAAEGVALVDAKAALLAKMGLTGDELKTLLS